MTRITWPTVAWIAWNQRVSRLHQDERGQISLLIAVIVLGMGVACCFVGGVAERVADKIEVQQAADSVAYSNALWSARSLNAVTTTNHLMGELTALCVIHEGLGALRVERDNRRNSGELRFSEPSFEWSKQLLAKKNAIYPSEIERLPQVVPLPAAKIREFDRRIVEQCVDILGEDSDDRAGYHRTGAAIYDSLIRLKEQANYVLQVKAILKDVNIVANQVSIIPKLWPFMVVIDTIAAGLHIAADVLLVDLAKEKVFLKGLDTVWPALGSFKEPVRKVVIPALSQYADSVVGYEVSGPASLGIQAFPARQAQLETIERLQKYYGVEVVVQHPRPSKFRLPLVPDPIGNPGATVVIPATNWSGESMSKRASMRHFIRAIDSLFESLRPLQTLFDWAKRIYKMGSYAIKPAQYLLDEADKLLNGTGSLSMGLIDLFDTVDRLSNLLRGGSPGTRAADLMPYSHNPTHDSFERFKIDVSQESVSQWVRATYPYVDSYRAPFRNFFDRTIPNSCMRTYFTHWTNRFTLMECYFRRRVDLDGNFHPMPSRADRETNRLPTVPKMYVLRGMTPTTKGNEQWTNNQRMAEELFTVVVAARRKSQPSIFGPGLFRNATEDGTLAFAQAMFYNANGRDLVKPGNPTVQVNSGWDTLNWAVPVIAPEWQRGQPADTNSGGRTGGSNPVDWSPPLDVFTGRPAEPIARTKINWQSRLVPITRTRLRDLMPDVEDEPTQRSILFWSQQQSFPFSH